MSDDVILITIDCWRYDAPNEMTRLEERTSDFSHREAICHSAATDGSFPAILSSSYYPRVYTDDGKLDPETESLPSILGESGYSTGAFIGANPFLNKWEDHFDEFWNGDFTEGINNFRSLQAVNYIKRLLTLSQRYPASTVGQKAEEWYRSQSPPRFLWLHLMDPHEPFHPGFRRGWDVGLFSSYLSLLEYRFTEGRFDGTLSKRAEKMIPELYRGCLYHLDENIDSVLGFLGDNSTVLITGDHGEEFDHGVYAHARLYDECVRVPFLSRWTLPGEGPTAETVRQIDLAPSILRALEIERPDDWTGVPFDGSRRTAHMLSRVPQMDCTFAGVRTSDSKLVKTYDMETQSEIETEYYDLEGDSGELLDQSEKRDIKELESELDTFQRYVGLDGTDSRTGNVPEGVQQRLEELGYK